MHLPTCFAVYPSSLSLNSLKAQLEPVSTIMTFSDFIFWDVIAPMIKENNINLNKVYSYTMKKSSTDNTTFSCVAATRNSKDGFFKVLYC